MDIKLPINEESERLILGRMMNSVNTANIVFEKLEESDFFGAENRAIFNCGYRLFSKDRVIDATSILTQMECDFPQLANYSTVHGLANYYAGVNISLDQYIDILKKYSISRKVINFSKEMMIEASSLEHSAEEIKNVFLKDSDTIFKSLNEGNIQSLSQILKGDFRGTGRNFIDYVQNKQERRAAGYNTIEGYLSGYKLLDDCLEGFNKKHYMIIGARAGIGKTTFILNLIKRFMERNLKVGFFSLEMSADMVVEKFLCLCAGVDQKKLSRGDLLPDEFHAILEASRKIDDSILIDDQPNLQVSQLAARAKRMVKAHGVQVIFIDYLSEVKGDGRFPNKQEEIMYVSKAIRAVAKNLNIPIICLAQLNRENEKAERKPRKSDLRESGQIEADAYSIMLLHRDDENRPGVIELHVVKNRMGKESSFDFSFDGKTGTMEELGYYKMRNKEKEEEIKNADWLGG